MGNGSLWSNVVFSKGGHFSGIWFRDLIFRIWDLEIKHLNAHNFVWQFFFFFHYYLATFSDFHRFVILCICWDAASEKTGLWQLPVVSRVFNVLWKNTFIYLSFLRSKAPLFVIFIFIKHCLLCYSHNNTDKITNNGTITFWKHQSFTWKLGKLQS